MMDKLVHDDIPNIRFNVAKSYSVLIDVLKRIPEHGTLTNAEKSGSGPGQGSQRGHDLIKHAILPNLQNLQQDDDVDVRFFATTATQSYGDAMVTGP